MKKSNTVLLIVICFINLFTGQVKTESPHKSRSKQSETIKHACEAEYIIRVGNVDDHNFGFPGELDPFCGSPTDGYSFATYDQTKGSVKVSVPATFIPGVEIKNVYLQFFTNDFQASVFHSEFRMLLNEKVIPEGGSTLV
jgi:hypothetical protein